MKEISLDRSGISVALIKSMKHSWPAMHGYQWLSRLSSLDYGELEISTESNGSGLFLHDWSVSNSGFAVCGCGK